VFRWLSLITSKKLLMLYVPCTWRFHWYMESTSFEDTWVGHKEPTCTVTPTVCKTPSSPFILRTNYHLSFYRVLIVPWEKSPRTITTVFVDKCINRFFLLLRIPDVRTSITKYWCSFSLTPGIQIFQKSIACRNYSYKIDGIIIIKDTANIYKCKITKI